MYKWAQTLSYAHALRSIHLFSPLLEPGGQFHVCLTAQAEDAVPRIFAFQHTNPSNTQTHYLIYDY